MPLVVDVVVDYLLESVHMPEQQVDNDYMETKGVQIVHKVD